MHFLVKKGVVVAGDTPLAENISPKIVEVWDRAQAIAGLMPGSVVVAERQVRLKKICDVMNAIANGADAEDVTGALDEVEAEIQSEQSGIRSKVTRLAAVEIGWTLSFSALALIAYIALRNCNFVANSGDDEAYARNILQNIVGAVGWSALGFCIGLAVRRIYEMQTLPFAGVVERANKKTPPLLAAVGNVVLILTLFFSIYYGVSLVTTGVSGWMNIELPRSSVFPGIALGLTAPRIMKTLLG